MNIEELIQHTVKAEDAYESYRELTPQEYFEAMKSKKQQVSETDLKRIYDNCLELANKYRITGQIRGLRKILFCMESIEKEFQLVEMGIQTFIYKDDIDFYIDYVARKRESKTKPIKIIELERYEREIPDEIVAIVDKTKELFDQMYVVYTDYTDKEERKIAVENRLKDPILFGTFLNKDKKVCVDRFYYLGDWIDDYCDLTLDKMVNESARVGRNIVRTLKTPKDVKELREYIDAHYEVEKDSLSVIVRKPDADLSGRKNVFQQIKTFFTRGK